MYWLLLLRLVKLPNYAIKKDFVLSEFFYLIYVLHDEKYKERIHSYVQYQVHEDVPALERIA